MKVKLVKKKSPMFKVTLHFSFNPQYSSSEELEKGEDSYDGETNEEFCERISDWVATDKKIGSDIESHVKKIPAKDFIEYILPYTILSAEWNNDFSLTFLVKTDGNETAESIKQELESESLEDGEYESGGDNGWTVKTLKGIMEYGLTDYRNNTIEVEKVSKKNKNKNISLRNK